MSAAQAAQQNNRTGDGRYAEKAGVEPDLALLPDLTGWEPCSGFPYPQANDLDKVALVADCVANGADTPDAIAQALGMVPREGQYYLSAAGWFGLIERDPDPGMGGATYRLAGPGEDFQRADTQTRALTLAAMVNECGDAEWAVNDPEGLVRELEVSGLAAETAARRVATMRAWAVATADPNRLGSLLTSRQSDLAGTIGGASVLAAQQRDAARVRLLEIARQSAPSYGQMCPRCFTTMSLTGVCGNCD